MPGQSASAQLHLSDFSIKGFFGLEDLSIPRLGRVTLLVGRNSVGKTTVLDAVQIYAARGRPATVEQILRRREELALGLGEDQEPVATTDVKALFFGRSTTQVSRVSIGPMSDALTFEFCARKELSSSQQKLFDEFPIYLDSDVQLLKSVFQRKERLLPWAPALDDPARLAEGNYYRHSAPHWRRLQRRFVPDEWPLEIKCQSLGPGLLDNTTIAGLWDSVALTRNEELLNESLSLILGSAIEGVAVTGNGQERNYRGFRQPRVVAKLPNQPRPVPLKSLGDGVTRMCGVALALANSHSGFLLIDEVENGIHQSVQQDFWRMVLLTAQENNAQVFATTHSWDCVAGFAKASAELEQITGALVRLEQEEGRVKAVQYSEEDLKTAAEQGIEVR